MRGRVDYAQWLIEAGAKTNVWHRYSTQIFSTRSVFQAVSTLKATPLHFACSYAPDDETCYRMIEVLRTTDRTGIAKLVNTSWLHELVSMVNSNDQTATCLAAERGFLESVTHLLSLYECQVKNSDICQMELEYGVRSNNPAILDVILEKHGSCSQKVLSKVNTARN